MRSSSHSGNGMALTATMNNASSAHSKSYWMLGMDSNRENGTLRLVVCLDGRAGVTGSRSKRPCRVLYIFVRGALFLIDDERGRSQIRAVDRVDDGVGDLPRRGLAAHVGRENAGRTD